MNDRLPPVFSAQEPEGDEPGAAAGSRRSPWPPVVYEGMIRPEPIAKKVRERIEDFPDFPEPGILFRDLMPVLRTPALFERIVSYFAAEALRSGADSVAGIESRGFLLAAPVALQLGLPLCPIRKQGKLPGATIRERYALEYGEAELEIQAAALRAGSRVFVLDDLLATGGTLEAACRLVERSGARVAGLGVVVTLAALGGRARLSRYDLVSLVDL